MPFERQWSRIPLGVRWVVSLLIAAVAVVLLVRFVSSNDGNGFVKVNRAHFKVEAEQADILIGQEQAPVGVHIVAGRPVIDQLAAAVRRDMTRQVDNGTVDGPLHSVSCVIHGGTFARTGYHCIARVANVTYPFLVVLTPHAHHAWFCEKVYPPSPSENIPVTARCRA